MYVFIFRFLRDLNSKAFLFNQLYTEPFSCNYCFLSVMKNRVTNPALPWNSAMLEYTARKGIYAAFQTIVNIYLI